MASTGEEPPHRNRRSPRSLILGPIGLSRTTAKLIGSIGRITVPASLKTRAIGKHGLRRLRKVSNRSIAAIRQSITSAPGFPAQTARRVKRPAGRDHDLAGASHPNAGTRAPVDRGHAARPRAKTAATNIGRTAKRRRKPGERPASIRQEQVEAKPAKAQAQTRRPRQRRATSYRQAERPKGLEQHTLQELREQARDAGIDQSSSMTKAQLIKALQPSPTGSQTQTGTYEERTVEELQERAAKLEIKGRSSMTKAELIKALRDHR